MPTKQDITVFFFQKRGKPPEQDILSFCFPDPVKKKELYLTWLTNLSIEESFTSDKHKLVCKDHFKTSCFEGNLMAE
jgi:hypothetical protein